MSYTVEDIHSALSLLGINTFEDSYKVIFNYEVSNKRAIDRVKDDLYSVINKAINNLNTFLNFATEDQMDETFIAELEGVIGLLTFAVEGLAEGSTIKEIKDGITTVLEDVSKRLDNANIILEGLISGD